MTMDQLYSDDGVYYSGPRCGLAQESESGVTQHSTLGRGMKVKGDGDLMQSRVIFTATF